MLDKVVNEQGPVFASLLRQEAGLLLCETTEAHVYEINPSRMRTTYLIFSSKFSVNLNSEVVFN